MKQRYTLEVLRNKAYRKALVSGKQSQCFERSGMFPFTNHRVRIRRESDGAVVFNREPMTTS